MSQLGPDAVRSALISENDLLADLAQTSDPETPIPTCPGWTLANLTTHVGRGHRWAAAMVADHATDYLDTKAVPDGRPPRDAEGADRWLRDSAQLVLDNVDGTGAGVPIWTFTGPRPAQWWIRRRLHEATVHRADVLLALGHEVTMDHDIAADGLSEWLTLWQTPGRGRSDALLAEGHTVHLHGTDGGEWSIRPAGAMIDWDDNNSDAAVEVSGTALDLLLMMTRRIGTDDPRLTTSGDHAVLSDLLAKTPF
ncbi:maleylpyruvate isomerase family mycothiol-dependent enzyme [Antrihabitans cavernicola]|uniref:Maleylpyruvate isomerase family mycothiol-dependent enzyme n=1 Tax=Antrihabitans cavernicola TaxID=2495913 RepID=A0A5A7SAN7_9NOCA|nr:maleylpyruvate isomerase family mycothiol-dependent enzyme [Spelaeibacter cavernicola]KAA0021623.1 maleylpyruvate isomerase family mycothiol-dependent enzyme [Spelaeibacter cavernicola]